MAFALLFDRKHRVLLVKFGHVLTRQLLEAMVQAAREFAGVHGSRSSTSTSPICAPTAGSPRVMAGARRILVAPDDEMFGIARLYGLHQSTSQGEEPMVVRSLKAAYDLLDLKDPDFQPLD